MGADSQGEGHQVHPEADAWITAIHATEHDSNPNGSGIILDELRVLTCYHVIKNLDEKWVAFPKAYDGASTVRRRVDSVLLPDGDAFVRDLAILVLTDPIPAGATAAPVYFPEPRRLVHQRWWAFGFPSDLLGSTAYGKVGDVLAHGWVRLHRDSPDPVERGFSGSGLWCPHYQGVVGVVGHDDGAPGGGRAISLYQADQWFPGENLRGLVGWQAMPGQADPARYAPEVALAEAWVPALSADVQER